MYTTTIALLALAGTTLGHMHLHWPPTLKGDNNPFRQGDADPYLNYPYGCCGKAPPGPCKGHLDLVNTDEGRPVTQWTQGQKANFSLSGAAISTSQSVKGGTHYGGSGQIGFMDGKNFKVVKTFQGNHPLRDGTVDPSTQVFDFTVPADLPTGDRVVFAWTWVNREKEFNMNCAVVSITGSDGEPQRPEQSPASSAPPQPTSSSAASTKPSATPAPSEVPPSQPPQPPSQPPSQTESSSPLPTGSAQYTLEGCTCSCPYQTWGPQCSCYGCKSPGTKRNLVERKVLELHKRHLQNTARLNAPLRRSETVAWTDRPNMLIEIDYEGASCHSTGNPNELEFPDPGPDVQEGDGEYKLAPPACG